MCGEGGLGATVDAAGCVCVLQSGSSLLPLAWEWVKQCDETELVSGHRSM